jgi:hypothetical protein
MKRRLYSLSDSTILIPSYIYTVSYVAFLRDYVITQKGRPFKFEILSKVYSNLYFNEKILLDIVNIYKKDYKTIRISFLKLTKIKQSIKCPKRLGNFLSFFNYRYSDPDSPPLIPLETIARKKYEVYLNLLSSKTLFTRLHFL